MATGSLEDINKGNNASPSGLSEILDFLERTADVRLALSSVVQYLGASFGSSQALALTDSDCIDRVLLSWEALPSNDLADASLSVIARFAARHAKVSPRTLVQTNPLHDIRWSAIAEELQDCNASYVLARTIRYVGMPLVTFVLLRGPESQIWSEQDIEQFDDHCRSLAPTLYRILTARKADNEAAVEQAAVAEATVAQAGVESADSQPERYRRLVEYGDVLIFQMNPAHEISYINQRAIDFFGVKPTDFLGSTPVSWYELAHLDDLKVSKRNFVS